MKLKTTILTLALMLLSSALPAQRSLTLADNIRTLELKVNGEIVTFPILTIGADDRLSIAFDDLDADHKRYRFRLQHCDINWLPSDNLFESEFLASTEEEPLIENYEQSNGTTQNYTRYSFTLPSSYARPLLSGNYIVNIFPEETDDTIARACFSVLDPKAGITAHVTTNTEVDWNDKHQQVEMSVNANALPLRNPAAEITTVVLQNGRWDNAIISTKPTSIFGKSMKWEHSRELIFTAGNEYRKFEMTSTKYPGMGVERIAPFQDGYLAEIFLGEQRRNYIYDEDQNGKWVIASEEADDANVDTEADYATVEFCLDTPPLIGASVHVVGGWNAHRLDEASRMHYETGRGYVLRTPMKLGYYNYLFLTVPDRKGKASFMPYEGNFFQTENEYTLLVYFKEQGGRYSQLVGASRIFSSRKP